MFSLLFEAEMATDEVPHVRERRIRPITGKEKTRCDRTDRLHSIHVALHPEQNSCPQSVEGDESWR